MLEKYLNVRLRKREVAEGTLLALENGKVARSKRFQPNREFEESASPPCARRKRASSVCAA